MREEASDPGRRAARDPRVPERPRRARLPAGPRAPDLPLLRLPVPGPRRHPRDADRRGREAARGERREEEALTDLDDAAALRAADPGGMLEAVTSLPSHCREGYGAGRAAPDLPSAEGATTIAYCGMGSSAIGGEVLAAPATPR